MLAASWVPECSESKPPRSLLGTIGSGSSAHARVRPRAAMPRHPRSAARSARSGIRMVQEADADLDPAGGVQARRIEERGHVRGGITGVVGASGVREHEPVEETRIEHVEDTREEV